MHVSTDDKFDCCVKLLPLSAPFKHKQFNLADYRAHSAAACSINNFLKDKTKLFEKTFQNVLKKTTCFFLVTMR